MIRSSSGRDGVIVFFDVAETDRMKFATAMRAANLEECVPEAPHRGTALRSALMDTVAEFGMRRHGDAVEYKPLARGEAAFEAIRIVRGAEENTYPKLFTAAVGRDGQIHLLRNDSLHGFQTSIAWASPVGMTHGVEAAVAFMNARFRHYLNRLPGSTAGSLVRKAILRHLNGVALSRSGKAYFLPAASVGQYESLALSYAVDGDGLRFGWFRYEVEDHGFEQIISALRAEIAEVVSVVTQDLRECNDENRRMRRDSRDLRMTDLQAARDKLATYERALGVSLDELRSAIEQTQGLLAINGLLTHAA